MGDNCDELMQDIYGRIERAGAEAIPVTKWSKFSPKPWWNDELKQSKLRREQLYQQYRRSKSCYSIIAWKRSRAQHKLLVKKSKREAWIRFVETLRQGVPPAETYETMRKIKGQPVRKVNILKDKD